MCLHSDDTQTTWSGIVITIISNILESINVVIEEKYFTKYSVQPLQSVGYEGIIGFSIMLILLPILQCIDINKFSLGAYGGHLLDNWVLLKIHIWQLNK